LYECIRSANGKLLPTAADVAAIVRVAARGRVDFRETASERSQLGKDFEVYARDLATRIQLAAQERQDTRLEAEAAKAYGSYLTLFRSAGQLRAMRKNYAESLFASGGFVEAGRQYEALARLLPPSDAGREDLLYSAILSYFTALASKQPLSLFDTDFARAGVEQLGAVYVRGYPRTPRAPTVKFNVAKAYYDEGNFAKASDLFVAYVGEFPTTKEAAISAHLALDALHNLGDYERLIKVAQQLGANAALPPQVSADMREIAGHSRSEEIDELALRAGEKTGDVAQGLIEFAVGQKGTSQGELAMGAAFGAYRDKHDVGKMKETAWQFLQQYPKSKVAAASLLTLAHAATEATDYEDAEQAYEEFARRLPDAPQALEALVAAGTLRLLVGDRLHGEADLEKAMAVAPAARRVEIGEKLAAAKLDGGDLGGAATMAARVLEQSPADADAAAVLGRALLSLNRVGEAQQKLLLAGQAIQRASRGGAQESEAAGKVFFLLGESLYRQFDALGPSELEKKAQMVDALTQAYTGAAQLGSGADAIGSLYRIGRVYASIADDLVKTREPAGLAADQRAAFHDQLEKQAAPLRAQAQEAFTTCLRKARDLDIVSPFTAGCRTAGEVADTVVRAGFEAGPAAPAKIQELRLRLMKNDGDVEALRGLADAYLASGDAGHARLVLSRILELSEGDAPAQAELGAALWRLGKITEAAASLHRAVELDPENAPAKANLASMLCRMGDSEGAKAELTGVAQIPRPSYLVDGGYLRCH
ncbi:MAG: tetratricopeptide repeat protein, partial [Deltaproteobacteria bacterium]